MSWLESILRKPRTIITLMLMMIVVGFFAFQSIPREDSPDISLPLFFVSVSQQDISPEGVERMLVRPLETHLRGLEGVKELTSIAAEGYAGILLEFDINFDKESALNKIRDKVDRAKSEFPSDADEPIISETNFSLMPTIVVALSGRVPERTLYTHARKLKHAIEAIPTVLKADLGGQREEMIEVLIDSLKLESYDVTPQELLTSLNNNNALVPAGFIDSGNGRFNIKVPGLLVSAYDVTQLPIKASDEGIVMLGDVATIRRTFKDPTSYTRVNGQRAIAIHVTKRIGTNIIENNKSVRDVVKRVSSEWPTAIHIGYLFDQSNNIFESLKSLQSAIMTAIALVMIVVVASLGIRSALLIGFAIPTSFLIGFFILSLNGMTINNMVLFGLVLTVGMLVDGAIVIVEYADRKIAEGMERRDAYIRASKLMFWPILSSTATTLAAFLPMLLWPGVSGKFMSFLPITVIIVLIAAMLTALIFLPTLGSFLGRKKASKEETRLARKLAGVVPFEVEEIRGLTGVYVRMLKHLVANPLGNIAAIVGIMIIGFVVFNLFKSHFSGVEFFVEEEPKAAVVFVSGRGNLSASEARNLVLEVESEVLKVKGIENILTITQPPSGDSDDRPDDMIGEIQLNLGDYCCRRRAVDIFSEIRKRTKTLAGIKVEVRKVEEGPLMGKDIWLEVKSTDYVAAVAAVTQLHNQFETGFEQLTDIEDSRPLPGIEWQMIVDREDAAHYQAALSSVGTMVQLVTNGALIGKIRPKDSEDEIDVRVRFPRGERTLSKLDQLQIRTDIGLVPIINFVERQPKPKISSITRRDGSYVMDIKANVASDIVVDDKVGEIQTWLAKQSWPETVQFRFRGADEEQKESGDFLAKAGLAALFLMFVILVTMYNSFYQTILTLSTVVLSLLGVMIGLIVTGQKFSIIMTGTGIVALAGIVVNNAIVLIDTYNRFRSEGVHSIEAVLRTSAQRLRPILLTTLTTIAGLIPMATQININFLDHVVQVGSIGSIWWVQLSTAIIFGLAFSTILTLILIPVSLAMPSVSGGYLKRLYASIRGRVAAR